MRIETFCLGVQNLAPFTLLSIILCQPGVTISGILEFGVNQPNMVNIWSPDENDLQAPGTNIPWRSSFVF